MQKWSGCIFTLKLVKQWQTLALAWNSCAGYTVQYTVYCTIRGIPFNTLYTVQYSIYHSILGIPFKTLYTIQYIGSVQYSVYCKIHCILYNTLGPNNTLNTVQYTVYCILIRTRRKDLRSNIPHYSKKFPRAKPKGTSESKGVYLTLYPESSPNTDSISFWHS